MEAATINKGMHPGIENGRRIFPKVNTCANSSLGKRMNRALAGIEKHVEVHPYDTKATTRILKIKQIISGAA